MNGRRKAIQPTHLVPDKPAKERILEASDKLFRILGVRARIDSIAHEANSNIDTVLKHFGHFQRLVFLFVKSLIEQAEDHWREVEQEHPNDAEGRLRCWVLYEQGRLDDRFSPERLLARSAAELEVGSRDPLLAQIEQYWQAERRRVVRLCEAASFREPRELADKVLLLVHGAYGHHAPSRLLHQAADDLMVAHGATRKPLLSWDDD
jgi:AcrR family transcriptional regulator